MAFFVSGFDTAGSTDFGFFLTTTPFKSDLTSFFAAFTGIRFGADDDAAGVWIIVDSAAAAAVSLAACALRIASQHEV